MNPIFKSHEKDFMRIEAEQVCVDYNGTVALYDASLNLSLHHKEQLFRCSPHKLDLPQSA